VALRIDARLAWQIVAGEAILVDLADGKALGLNPTASLIWSLLETREPDEIARAVAARFDVDQGTARTDVDEFLSWLEDARLVCPA
jgi:hypothetical protein